MIAEMDIQNINILQEIVISYKKNINIVVNIFSGTKILTDITEYIKLGNICVYLLLPLYHKKSKVKLSS